MSGDGSQIRNRVAAWDKILRRGFYVVADGLLASNQPPDGGSFDFTTGNNGLLDLTPTAGVYSTVLIPATYNANGTVNPVGVPTGCALDVRSLAWYLLPGAAWSGGTAGNPSVTIQGTDGTPVCTINASGLTVATGAAGSGTISTGSVVTGGAAPAWGTDYGVRSIGSSLPVGVGLVAVVNGNSTAGANLRLSVQGRLATTGPGL